MIPVLLAHDDFLVLDKPCGLAVQPGEGVRVSLVEAVERDYGFRPYLVHRLDRETSGCIVVARSSRAASELSALMGGRGAVKRYIAVTWGVPEPKAGELSDDVSVRGRERSASTRYRVLSEAGPYALVEAELGSGRNHQIRRHFADAGWPVLADDRHGNFKANKDAAKALGAKRLFLHARYLYLPLTPPVSVEAQAPERFVEFCARAGLELQ